MAKILIIAEQRGGKIKKSTQELLSFASSAGAHEVTALLMGEGVQNIAASLGEYGAKKVLVCESAALKDYLPEAYVKAASEVISKNAFDVILCGHSPFGKDLMPRLSARLDAGLASDCTELKIDGNNLQARRPMYAGKASCAVEFLGSGPKLITVRPNSFPARSPQAGAKADVTSVSVNLDGLKSKYVETISGAMARPDVSEASIVVSGGRSLKNAENFKIIEELADTLGAAVGASRAAVDAGYRPHRDQVGQTGKVVSPTLYIACGISGAIQHLAGMRSSKTIVAINNDAEAPIFQIADYGIVGDLFTVVPLLTKEIKKLKE